MAGGRIGCGPGRRIGSAADPRQFRSEAAPMLNPCQSAPAGAPHCAPGRAGGSIAAFAGGAVRRAAQSSLFQPPHGRMRGRDRRIGAGRAGNARARCGCPVRLGRLVIEGCGAGPCRKSVSNAGAEICVGASSGTGLCGIARGCRPSTGRIASGSAWRFSALCCQIGAAG